MHSFFYLVVDGDLGDQDFSSVVNEVSDRFFLVSLKVVFVLAIEAKRVRVDSRYFRWLTTLSSFLCIIISILYPKE